MRKRLAYFVLDWYLFWESLLWTLIDFVRRGRMRHSARMHERYKPPSADAEQSVEEIKN